MTKTKNKKAVIKLNAGNDRNGNPRRCFVVIGTMGEILDVLDEGFNGIGALFFNYPEFDNVYYRPMEFETTAREYRRLLRIKKKKDDINRGRSNMPIGYRLTYDPATASGKLL